MRALVNTPDLSLGGGVAAYYRTLRKRLPENIDYFTIGARDGNGDGLRQSLRLLKDYASYARRVAAGKYSILELNPSVGTKALLRDGVFLLIGKLFGKRVLLFFHGWDPGCERKIRKSFPGAFRAICSLADGCVVLASEFHRNLRDLGYTGPVFLETTAIDDEIIESARPRDDGARFRVLFLARLERDKGIFEALDAYALAREAFPDMEMIVAGDGPSAEAVRHRARERQVQDVRFVGALSGGAKAAAFNSAGCYLLPTYHEGMPVSVLEAMAYGVPVITRPVGGICDFFRHGEMGFLETSTRPQAFAHWICELARDPDLCRRMGEHNRAVARERFAASKVAARVLQIFESVAK